MPEVNKRDEWMLRDQKRLQSENLMLRTEIARLNARVAHLELERMIAAHRDRTDVAWLQGKVLRQKKRLKALEEAKELSRIQSVEDNAARKLSNA